MTTTDPAARSPARAARTTSLSASSATAAAARAFVVEALGTWRIGADTVDDAELVVSELVTNACLHGHAAEVEITLADHDRRVRLEVAHHEAGGAGEPLTPLTAGADDTHGRGLAIVDVLAQAWGVTERPGTRRVWAEFGATRSGLVDPARRGPTVADLEGRVATATTPGALGAAVTGWATDHLGTSFAGIALVTAGRTHLEYLSVVPLPAASAATWVRFPVGTEVPVAAAFREGRAFFHESRSAVAATFPVLGPELADTRTSALANLPLRPAGGDETAFGTVTLAWEHGRELDAADRAWLASVAAVVAAAFVGIGATTSPATR